MGYEYKKVDLENTIFTLVISSILDPVAHRMPAVHRTYVATHNSSLPAVAYIQRLAKEGVCSVFSVQCVALAR